MKNFLKCLLLLVLLPFLSVANPLVLESNTASQDTVKSNWWIVGAEASNNSSFFGRNTATRYPFVAASVTYLHHTGFWAAATSYQLFNTPDFVDETDLSVGYSFKIKKRLEVDLSYTRFIFGKNTPLVNASTSDALSMRNAYDWKYLYSALITSYVVGSGNDVFTVLENSRYVPLNPLWHGGMPVGLDPKLSITAGTQHFSEVYTTTTYNKNNGPVSGGPLGGVLGPLTPGKKPGNGGTTDSTTTTTTTTVSRFKVLNYDLKLPVVLFIGSFEIEPSWRYSIPVNKLEGDVSEAQSFYNLSVKYTF